MQTIDNISTLEMGSSNTGDIEAQQHNPKWFDDHIHMLRPNQEGEVNKLGYFILKVPEHMREPPKAFSPRAWRFGLHNRENLDSNGSEAVKLGIAVQYGLVGEKWFQFCDAIVYDPRAMLACYGLQNGVTSWTNERIKHVLALDALFLADYIDRGLPREERRLCTPKTVPLWYKANDLFYANYKTWVDHTDNDLFRVENQIPFVLIDEVVKYISSSVASTTCEGNAPLIDGLQLYGRKSARLLVDEVADVFMVTTGECFEIDNSILLHEKEHILGAVYKVICGSKGIDMNQEVDTDAYFHVPSATKLKQSGIKIVGVDGPLCTMSYKKNCLSLPKMRMYDETTSFIRNMARYEMRMLDGCLFHNYILFMSDLIQTLEDLDLLMKCGVIYNTCGIEGFAMWTDLKEGLVEIRPSKIHHDMKVAIVSRCNLTRYRLWSEFRIVFCSKPWLVLSTTAVVMVTLATLLQTYAAVIGSNHMNPKFP